ncbi:TPA_asm: M [Mango betacytorhabdovirus 1]|nr:TPA_asm: M [Mango betacytorhabdovirus 1]
MEVIKIDDLILNFAMWRGSMTIKIVSPKESRLSSDINNLRSTIQSIKISEKSGGLLIDTLLWMHYLRVASVLVRKSTITDILFGAESTSYEICRSDPAVFKTNSRIPPSFLNNGASFYVRDTLSDKIIGRVDYSGNCGIEPVTAQEAGAYFRISPGIAILAEYNPPNKEQRKNEGLASANYGPSSDLSPNKKTTK